MGLQGVAGPGSEGWIDGFETVSTSGSVQIGSDTAKDCNADNEGSIRFNRITKMFEACDGTVWGILSVKPLCARGDTGPAGGVVFYITDGGLHGMEAAPANLPTRATWGCNSVFFNATRTAIGTGTKNTAAIVAGCSQQGAARLADQHTFGGYADWHLPSKDELHLIYLNRTIIPGLGTYPYWSSTELNSTTAIVQSMGLGTVVSGSKLASAYVRPVRAF